MKRWTESERGDTLIEVTMALAILAVVLMSATLITTRAFRLGQTARERTVVAHAAQAQAEALRRFRDNPTCAEVFNGGTIGGVSFNGVLNGSAAGPIACKTSPCLHMETKVFGPGLTEYVPTGGAMNGSVPTSFIETAVTPNPGSPTTSVDVTLSYGF